MRKLQIGVAVLTVCAATTTTGQTEQTNFTWEQNSESLTLMGPNGIVWRYRFAVNLPKPFFDPVRLLTGEELTWNEPPDHAWHHGLWFSWHTINGVNYWEHDPDTGRPVGRTSWTPPVIHTTPAGAARIEMHLAYSSGNAPPVLKEQRTIEVTAPDESGGYHLDWDATFTPTAGEVVLDRIPIPPDPNGKPWGGYAGLSVRFAAELRNVRLVTEKGEVDFDPSGIRRGRFAVCDYQARIGEGAAGIAILTHQRNPRGISPFYAIRGTIKYLNAAFLQDEPYEVTQGDPLRLRYRIAVHPERWSTEQVQDQLKTYLQFVNE